MKRVLAIGGLFIPLSCGGGDMLPECPTGSCVLPANTVVKWVFDHYPERQFPMDSCTDLGVARVEVDLTDAAGIVKTQTDSCDYAQTTFTGLAPGDYSIQIIPLDSSGAALVKNPLTGMVTASDMNVDTTVYVPWDAWVNSYTGTMLFRLSWGGVTCATANVKKQALKLMHAGAIVPQVTDTGEKLDGNDWQPCRELTEEFPQSVKDLPFGPATLWVEGRDQMDHTTYHAQLDVFIGAGISNPTVTYDVPAPPVDAGVDAIPAD